MMDTMKVTPTQEEVLAWEKQLRNIDWTYDYSDDGNVWRRGLAQQKELKEICEANPWKAEQTAFFKKWDAIKQELWQKHGYGKSQKEYLTECVVRLEDFMKDIPDYLKAIYANVHAEYVSNPVYKLSDEKIKVVTQALIRFNAFYSDHPIRNLHKFCNTYSRTYRKLHGLDHVDADYVSYQYLAISEELESEITALHGTLVGFDAFDALDYCIRNVNYLIRNSLHVSWANYSRSPIIEHHVSQKTLVERTVPWLVIDKLALFPIK